MATAIGRRMFWRLFAAIVLAAIATSASPHSGDKVMNVLHSGFAGSAARYFLPEKSGHGNDRQRTFMTDALPGVKVHVLGPPRSRDVIRDMDPPEGESYLRMHSASDKSTALNKPLRVDQGVIEAHFDV